MILQRALCTAAIENPFYFPWFCQESLGTDPLYPQRRTLLIFYLVCLCCWLSPGFLSSQVLLVPHNSSGDVPVPPMSFHLKETQEGGCDLFCLLRWMVRTLGWQGTLRSAFCLQSGNRLWVEFKFECDWNGWTVLVFLKEEERRNERNSSEFQHCNRSVGLLSVKVCFIHHLQDNYVKKTQFLLNCTICLLKQLFIVFFQL